MVVQLRDRERAAVAALDVQRLVASTVSEVGIIRNVTLVERLFTYNYNGGIH